MLYYIYISYTFTFPPLYPCLCSKSQLLGTPLYPRLSPQSQLQDAASGRHGVLESEECLSLEP